MFKIKGNIFLTNSFINMVGALGAGFLGFLFNFAISRKLSVSQYGELQSLASLFAVLTTGTVAISYFVVRYTSVFSKHQDFNSNNHFIQLIKNKINLFNLFFLGVFFLISPLIFNFLNLSDYFGLIFLGPAIIFSTLSSVDRGALQGWNRFGFLTSTALGSSGTKLLIGFAIASFFPKASWVIGALLVSSLVAWLVAKWGYRQTIIFGQKNDETITFDWKEKYFSKRRIKKTVVPIFIFSLMITLAQNLDVMLIKSVFANDLAGYYSALSILGKVILWANLAIIGVVLPQACAEGENHQNNRVVLWQAYGLITLISIVSVLVYAAFPSLVVGLLFGQKYILFADKLWFFGIMAWAMSFLILESNLAYGRADHSVSYILIAVVSLMTLLVYFFHKEITQVAWLFTFSFTLGYFCLLFKRLYVNLSRKNLLMFFSME